METSDRERVRQAIKPIISAHIPSIVSQLEAWQKSFAFCEGEIRIYGREIQSSLMEEFAALEAVKELSSRMLEDLTAVSDLDRHFTINNPFTLVKQPHPACLVVTEAVDYCQTLLRL